MFFFHVIERTKEIERKRRKRYIFSAPPPPPPSHKKTEFPISKFEAYLTVYYIY
jgi:hypothetical protein